MRLAIALLAGFAVALGGASTPADACACGVAIEATVSEERALVIEGAGDERIILSLDLEADSQQDSPAVVLPVPGEPRVEAIEGGDPLDYLESATQFEITRSSGGGGEAAGAPVDVIGREEVGGYDVSRLRADDPQALNGWLDANGYSLPDGAEPILSDYIDDQWSFVAIRLAPGSSGTLKPLDVRFPTEQPVYPMRLEQLASEPLSLTLFAVADGPRSVPGLATVWADRVDQLSPPPPDEFAELFPAGRYVSRMQVSNEDPARFVNDLMIEPAGEGIETALTAPASDDDDDGLSALAIVAICAGAVAMVALAALALRRRAT